jgi:hypothetical protein
MDDMIDEISVMEKIPVPCSSLPSRVPVRMFAINNYYGTGGI